MKKKQASILTLSLLCTIVFHAFGMFLSIPHLKNTASHIAAASSLKYNS